MARHAPLKIISEMLPVPENSYKGRVLFSQTYHFFSNNVILCLMWMICQRASPYSPFL